MSGSIHLATQVFLSPTCVIRSQLLYGTAAVKERHLIKMFIGKITKRIAIPRTFSLLSPFWFFTLQQKLSTNVSSNTMKSPTASLSGCSWNSLNIVQLPRRLSWGKDPLKRYKDGSYVKLLMAATVLVLIYCFMSVFWVFLKLKMSPNSWHSTGEGGSSPYSLYHQDSAS